MILPNYLYQHLKRIIYNTKYHNIVFLIKYFTNHKMKQFLLLFKHIIYLSTIALAT